MNPDDRSEYHRFTPTVMRVETTDHRCLDCQNVLSVGTGPVAARRYDYVAREVAAALVALARGSTYQDAAQAAREAVRHELAAAGADDWWPAGGSVRHGQLAADWLEVFAPVVLEGQEEVGWPAVVLLDSTSFWRFRGGATVPAFHVLAAYGYDLTTPLPPPVAAVRPRLAPRIRTIPSGAVGLAPGEDPWATPEPVLDGLPDLVPAPGTGRGRLLRAVAYRASNLVTWTDFLSSWPGTPQVVVADAAREIRPAVAAAWPGTPTELGPEFVSCRWHWAKNLRSTLADDLALFDEREVPPAAKRKAAQAHPLWSAAERAFDSRQQWDAYRQWAHQELAYRRWPARTNDNPRAKGAKDDGEERLPATLAWLRDHDLAFVVQEARRTTRPGPESTGPLEAELQFLRQHLARRAQSLRNRERTNLLLRLMVVGRRGQANERLWAERLRRHLADRQGLPRRQRRLVEHGGARTL